VRLRVQVRVTVRVRVRVWVRVRVRGVLGEGVGEGGERALTVGVEGVEERIAVGLLEGCEVEVAVDGRRQVDLHDLRVDARQRSRVGLAVGGSGEGLENCLAGGRALHGLDDGSEVAFVDHTVAVGVELPERGERPPAVGYARPGRPSAAAAQSSLTCELSTARKGPLSWDGSKPSMNPRTAGRSQKSMTPSSVISRVKFCRSGTVPCIRTSLLICASEMPRECRSMSPVCP
jgi:hypothetical protein